MAKLYIATPTARGEMFADVTKSLLDTGRALLKAGHDFDFFPTEGADISTQRNMAATRFLAAADFTHLLMVDADNPFRPHAVMRMIESGKDLIGCVYPHRTLDFRKMMAAARSGLDDNAAYLSALTFVSDDGPVRIENGIAEREAVGMGITLISRAALTKVLPDVARYERGGEQCCGFFDHIPPALEDVSFCQRWRKHGQIFALVDEPVGHIGVSEVRASFLDYLNVTRSKR